MVDNKIDVDVYDGSGFLQTYLSRYQSVQNEEWYCNSSPLPIQFVEIYSASGVG